jgi:serine/threonine protein kinase
MNNRTPTPPTDHGSDLPRRLGRYILLERLHGGGMTDVYAARLAEEVGPGRLLVIKILPLASSADTEAEARFLEESRIVLNLTHGNITTAFEFGREDGRPFLVLEYVPGPSLHWLLEASTQAALPLGIGDGLFIVGEVCRALAYAHTFSGDGQGGEGIVHRDISPGNILISTAGQVKLTDFGIAQFTRAERFGRVWGKAAYIAPELVAGNPPGPASDLYSLGAVLYEILTGTPPFAGQDDGKILARVAAEDVRPPTDIRPDIPPDVERLVLALLEKQPDRRPESASAVLITIGTLLGELPGTAAGTSLPETIRSHLPSPDYFDPAKHDPLRAGMVRAGLTVKNGESTDVLLAQRTMPLEQPGGDSSSSRPKPIKLTERLKPLAPLALLIGVAGFAFYLSANREPPAGLLAPVQTQGKPAGPKVDLPEKTTPDASVEPAQAKPQNRPVKKRQQATVTQTGDQETGPADAPGEAATWGWANINSSPWSFVAVDGKQMDGHTPFTRAKLPAGPHTLVFENPELGLKATRTVRIKPWEEITIGVKLE